MPRKHNFSWENFDVSKDSIGNKIPCTYYPCNIVFRFVLMSTVPSLGGTKGRKTVFIYFGTTFAFFKLINT